MGGHGDESKVLAWCLLYFSGQRVHVEQIYTEKSVKTGLADFLWRSEVGEKLFFDQKRFRSNFSYLSTKVGFYDVLSKKM